MSQANDSIISFTKLHGLSSVKHFRAARVFASLRATTSKVVACRGTECPQSVKRHVEICLALSERDICVNPPPEGPTGLAVEEVVNRSEKREPSTNDASQQPDHLLRYQPMRLVPLSRCAYMGKMRSRSQLYICTRTIRQNVFARLS
jgi:hypothetical protein